MENEKHLGIWRPMSVFAPVCGLALFFGLGNRVIISVSDGSLNVICCFHPSRSPGNTTLRSLFLPGLKLQGHHSSRKGRVSPQMVPTSSFRNLCLLLVFPICGNMCTFFGVYISIDLSFLHRNTVLPIGKKLMKQYISFTCLFLLGIGCCVMSIMGTLRSLFTLLMQYEPIIVHNSPAHPGRCRRF